jgi:hypothetical protein
VKAVGIDTDDVVVDGADAISIVSVVAFVGTSDGDVRGSIDAIGVCADAIDVGASGVDFTVGIASVASADVFVIIASAIMKGVLVVEI